MKHKTQWIAISKIDPTNKVARNSIMKDADWGWDAVCSCGWKTTTGGALASFVRFAVKMHKMDEEAN